MLTAYLADQDGVALMLQRGHELIEGRRECSHTLCLQPLGDGIQVYAKRLQAGQDGFCFH